MSAQIKAGLYIGIRILALIVAVTVGITIMVAGSQVARASSIYLKNLSVISGDRITLGDIFGGIEEGKDKVLGRAPQPGADMVLNARTLLRIAIALDLPWRPASSADHVVLKRAASIVGNDVLKALVEDDLRIKEGLSGRFDVDFTTTGNEIVLPHDQPATAEITELTFNAQRDWFQVSIVAPSADNPLSKRQLTGAVKRITSVPVLKDNMRNGDIIQTSDIAWIDLYSNELQHDYYLDAEKVIGTTPRRMVVAGKPIRQMELDAPKIIKRGDTVTIIYEQGPMRLTTEGRALRDGAKGDYVRVVNNNSNQPVDGVVTAPRTVTVR